MNCGIKNQTDGNRPSHGDKWGQLGRNIGKEKEKGGEGTWRTTSPRGWRENEEPAKRRVARERRGKSRKGGVTDTDRKHCFKGKQSIAVLNSADKTTSVSVRYDNTEVDNNNNQCIGGQADEACLDWTERERGNVCRQITTWNFYLILWFSYWEIIEDSLLPVT